MALFSTKTDKKQVAAKRDAIVKAPKKKVAKKTTVEAAVTAPEVKAASTAHHVVPTSVIIAPHVTEKSGIQSEAMNVYTFHVANEATKVSVRKAIKTQFKVTPIKINITVRPSRTANVRGRLTTVSKFKKAIVFLKKGDKIDFA